MISVVNSEEKIFVSVYRRRDMKLGCRRYCPYTHFSRTSNIHDGVGMGYIWVVYLEKRPSIRGGYM
jgi:hypothetical protein